MAEYMNKELFLSYMGLTGDETKYGNRDAEHLHRSYSTYMSYEIMDCVDDSIVEEELVPVVHGRWENHPKDTFATLNHCEKLRCTNCWHFFYHNYGDGKNYCPNCGAMMKDGE